LFETQSNKPAILLILLTAVFFGVFCTYYVSIEDPVYVWDFGEFWRMYQQLGERLASGSPGWFRGVLASVYSQDYNISGALPLLPTYFVFGGGRSAYVASIAVLYGVPACVLAAYIAIRACSLKHRSSKAATFLIAASSLSLWTPTLRGMWDVAGLIPLGVATILILRTQYLARASIPQLMAAGILLWAAFLLRRWYAYSVVAIMAITFCFALVASGKETFTLKGVFWTFSKFALVTTVFFLVALAMQYELVSRVLHTNYGDLYAAYQKSFSENLTMAVQRTGVVNCVIIATGIVSAVFSRALQVIFCAMVAIIEYLLFTRTQMMGVHHFLPVAFWLFPALIFGVKSIGSTIRLREQLSMVAFAAIAIVAFFGSTVLPSLLPDSFSPQASSRPLRLDNRGGYGQLIQAIRNNRRGSEQVATFGSSLKLSDDLLRSLAPDIRDYIASTPHVASLQPFRFDLLRADYQVASAPAQTQLAPGAQRHLEIPNNMLIEGKGFGSGYTKIGGPYKLSEGVDAFLYKRTRPLTLDDVDQVFRLMVDFNPAWRVQFLDTMEPRLALRTQSLGDKWGRATIFGDNVFLSPGENTPTEMSVPLKFNDSKQPKAVSFAVSADVLASCPTADGVDVTMTIDGTPTWKGALAPGSQQTVTIPPFGETLSILVDKRGNPYCDQLSVTFSITPKK
jgi:hypothetical protein